MPPVASSSSAVSFTPPHLLCSSLPLLHKEISLYGQVEHSKAQNSICRIPHSFPLNWPQRGEGGERASHLPSAPGWGSVCTGPLVLSGYPPSMVMQAALRGAAASAPPHTHTHTLLKAACDSHDCLSPHISAAVSQPYPGKLQWWSFGEVPGGWGVQLQRSLRLRWRRWLIGDEPSVTRGGWPELGGVRSSLFRSGFTLCDVFVSLDKILVNRMLF